MSDEVKNEADLADEFQFTDEPEQPAEQVTEEAEQPEEAPPATEQVTEPADEPGQTKPEQPHAFDKGLQKLQMEFSAYQRKSAEDMRELRELLQQKQEQKQAVEDELSKLDNDEFADEHTKALAKRLRAIEQQNQKLVEYQQRYEQQQAQQTAQLQADFARRSFQQEHPDLADRYDKLVEETREELKEDASDPSWTPQTWARYANRVWQQKVQSAKSQVATPAPSAPSDNVSTTPDKDTRGAQVKKPGAPKAPTPKQEPVDLDELVNRLSGSA